MVLNGGVYLQPDILVRGLEASFTLRVRFLIYINLLVWYNIFLWEYCVLCFSFLGRSANCVDSKEADKNEEDNY